MNYCVFFCCDIVNMTYLNDKTETLTDFFNWVDQDHDGFISKSEVNEAMAADIDNDGLISQTEKTESGLKWINSYYDAQDLNADDKISLSELLAFNAL